MNVTLVLGDTRHSVRFLPGEPLPERHDRYTLVENGAVLIDGMVSARKWHQVGVNGSPSMTLYLRPLGEFSTMPPTWGQG